MTTVQETLRKQSDKFLKLADETASYAAEKRVEAELLDANEAKLRDQSKQFSEAADKLDAVES